MNKVEKAQNRFIFIVLVYTYFDSEDRPGYAGYTLSCTGTLIREDIVLTAAHCLRTEDRVREIKITLFSGVERKALSFHIHPGWPLRNYDLAILILPSTSVRAYLSLPTAPLARASLNCATGGFGHPRPSMDTYKYIKFEKTHTEIQYIGSNLIIADFEGLHPCKGDSGGPLFCNNTIYGVLSQASNAECSETSSTILYVSTITNRKWIQIFLTLPMTPPPDETLPIVIIVIFLVIIIVMVVCFVYLIKKYF